jgi:hypothetical protein
MWECKGEHKSVLHALSTTKKCFLMTLCHQLTTNFLHLNVGFLDYKE